MKNVFPPPPQPTVAPPTVTQTTAVDTKPLAVDQPALNIAYQHPSEKTLSPLEWFGIIVASLLVVVGLIVAIIAISMRVKKNNREKANLANSTEFELRLKNI